jgi:hypothetical protein
MLVAAASFDALSSLATSRLTWLLAGLGSPPAERRAGPLRLPPLRAALQLERGRGRRRRRGPGHGACAVVPERHAADVVIATLEPADGVEDLPPASVAPCCRPRAGRPRRVSRNQTWTLVTCD